VPLASEARTSCAPVTPISSFISDTPAMISAPELRIGAYTIGHRCSASAWPREEGPAPHVSVPGYSPLPVRVHRPESAESLSRCPGSAETNRCLQHTTVASSPEHLYPWSGASLPSTDALAGLYLPWIGWQPARYRSAQAPPGAHIARPWLASAMAAIVAGSRHQDCIARSEHAAHTCQRCLGTRSGVQLASLLMSRAVQW
jgi:hypothetical protein